MKIHKIGHCCLQIDVGEVRILTDPGNFSDGQNDIEHINAVIITHEHPDHCHTASLQQILLNNPGVVVYANESTGSMLNDEGIDFELIGEGFMFDVDGVSVQTWNCEHADVYDDITPVLNTALFINGQLLYPGDAYFVPGVPVDILAVPVEGPWVKTREAIEYALTIKPRQAFPVHDARLDPQIGEARYAHHKRVLEDNGITWHGIDAGGDLEI